VAVATPGATRWVTPAEGEHIDITPCDSIKARLSDSGLNSIGISAGQ
jgi:hypothetical protein